MYERQSLDQGGVSEASVIFSDRGEIAEYAAEAVSVMSGNEILCGYEDGTFRPEQNISRAESAVLIARMLEWMERDEKVLR